MLKHGKQGYPQNGILKFKKRRGRGGPLIRHRSEEIILQSLLCVEYNLQTAIKQLLYVGLMSKNVFSQIQLHFNRHLDQQITIIQGLHRCIIEILCPKAYSCFLALKKRPLKFHLYNYQYYCQSRSSREEPKADNSRLTGAEKRFNKQRLTKLRIQNESKGRQVTLGG